MAASRFVVQLHDATALHFDLRIQVGEVLHTLAVPSVVHPARAQAVRRVRPDPHRRERWILVRVRDEHAQTGSDIVAEHPASVRSGRTWQLADGHPPDHGH